MGEPCLKTGPTALVPHLGTFRPFMVRTVYTEQAIIVAGIRRSALVSVSSEFRVANGSANHETYKTKRLGESGPRASHTRELFFFPPVARTASLNGAVEEGRSAASHRERLRCPDAVTGAARSRDRKSIDIGGRTAILACCLPPIRVLSRRAHTVSTSIRFRGKEHAVVDRPGRRARPRSSHPSSTFSSRRVATRAARPRRSGFGLRGVF